MGGSKLLFCLFEKWQSETEPRSGNRLALLHFVMEMGDISQTVTLSSHPFPLDYLDPSELNPFVIPSLFSPLLFVPSQTRSLQTPAVLNYANCVRGSARFGRGFCWVGDGGVRLLFSGPPD